MSEAAAPFSRDSAWRRALLLAAAVAGFAAGVALLPLESWIAALREWTATHGVLGLAVFAVAYAALTFFLVPGALLMLAAGLAFGMTGAIPVLGGAALSAVSGFLAGRYFARGRVLKAHIERPAIGDRLHPQALGCQQVHQLLRLVPPRLEIAPERLDPAVAEFRALVEGTQEVFGVRPLRARVRSNADGDLGPPSTLLGSLWNRGRFAPAGKQR